MKTLYDLLGARPDDDVDGLRDAFRKAVKANHPDLHIGDRDAAMRLRQIVQAYDILRDTEQRATYDRLLVFEREQLRWTLTRVVSRLTHNIFADAIAGVSFAMVLGGCILLAYMSKTSVDAVKLADVTARGAAPAEIAAVPPAVRADTTKTDELRDRFNFTALSEMPTAPAAVASTTTDGGAPEATKAKTTPSSTRPNTEAAKPDDASDVPIQQADVKASADRPEKNPVMEPLDQERPQSAELPTSFPEKDNGFPEKDNGFPEKDNGSPEKDNGVAKPAASEVAMSRDEHDVETPAAPDASTGDVRASDAKTSDAKTSDAKTSDVMISDAKAPDPKISDTKTSEVKASEANTSDPKISDTKTSEVKASQANAPDPKISDTKTSEVKASEDNTSDPKISDTKTSEVKASEANAPDPKISDTKTSEVKASQANAPDPKISDTKTPETKISDAKTPEPKISDAKTLDPKISDAKIPETKTARTRTVARRQAPSRTTVEQISLENKNTPACSGSCSDNAPPLFGVGF